MVACSSSIDAANVGSASPEAEEEESDAGDLDVDAESTSSAKDAGAKKDASSNDAAKDAANDAGSKQDGASGTDASGTDATVPLVCLASSPTVTCGATFSATSTATSGIALTDMGPALRVAVDPSGQLHAAWSTPTQGIRYAASKTSAFAVETIALPSGLASEVFLFPRVVVDDCGRPFVAYLHRHLPAGTDVTESHVYLATKSAGGWSTEEVVVPTSASSATPATDIHTVDLTLDGAGKPVLALGRWSTKSAYVARPSGGGAYSVEEVPNAVSSQLAGLPAVTFSSTLGIVLGVDVAAKPTLMWKSGSTWNASTVVTTQPMDTGRMLAIASDAQGAVHVAWRQSLPPTSNTQQKLSFLYAASNTSGALSAPEVVQTASGPSVPYSQSLSIDVGPTQVPVLGIDGFPVRRKGAQQFAKTAVVTGMSNYRSVGMALDTSGRARSLAFGYSAGALVTEACP